MPDGLGGEARGYDRYASREPRERRMQRQREGGRDREMQEFYNTTLSGSFTINASGWDYSAYMEDLWVMSHHKPKPPKRPVSAIFYPMVHECGY